MEFLVFRRRIAFVEWKRKRIRFFGVFRQVGCWSPFVKGKEAGFFVLHVYFIMGEEKESETPPCSKILVTPNWKSYHVISASSTSTSKRMHVQMCSSSSSIGRGDERMLQPVLLYSTYRILPTGTDWNCGCAGVSAIRNPRWGLERGGPVLTIGHASVYCTGTTVLQL